MGSDQRDARAKLAALLEPHLDELRAAAPEPEPDQEPAQHSSLLLTESELMVLIFASLDDDNPRVCEGIDFERIVILRESTRDATGATDEPPDEPADEPPDEPPEGLGDDEPPDAGPDATDWRQIPWVGAGWIDDIAAVPAELLDRPTLDAAQTQLVARVRGRALASVNLRRLDRAAALRHLELFVRACRLRRQPLCRVITGKGVHSRGEPVIKRAVVEWCRGPGRRAVLGWAPLLDRHGEWGAAVLRLSTAPFGGTTRP
jgi:hypothetical protein